MIISFGENSKRDTKKYLCSTSFLWTCKRCYQFLDSFLLNHQNPYFKFERADFLLPNRKKTKLKIVRYEKVDIGSRLPNFLLYY